MARKYLIARVKNEGGFSRFSRSGHIYRLPVASKLFDTHQQTHPFTSKTLFTFSRQSAPESRRIAMDPKPYETQH